MSPADCIPVFMYSDWLSPAPCRVRVRYQKRQKLQFETKLGMNSPFWCVPSENVCVESVLEAREVQDASTSTQPNIIPSAQMRCNHQGQQISTKCNGGRFKTQILELLGLITERDLYSGGYMKGRKRKIPKQSFPMNRKEN